MPYPAALHRARQRARRLRSVAIPLAAALAMLPCPARSASHREAPITSLDRTADITDFYAFRSPDLPDTLSAIMCTDPLLEPSNGPNYFPFDPEVIYEINFDADHDAQDDFSFLFVFDPLETRLPGVPVGLAGAGDGVPAPANSPAPIAPGSPLIPPAITSLDGPGSEGLGLRQRYIVALRQGDSITELSRSSGPLFAVPSNVGPRTMPDYEALYKQGVRDLGNGVRVFAGTVDDAFFIDLGAAFDSLNFRSIPGNSAPGVLSPSQDANDRANFNSDAVSGYNVNCLALQVPIASIRRQHDQIGLWATTSRSEVTRRAPGAEVELQGALVQVQRMANPLFNELLIATNDKNRWSRSLPANDGQFLKQLQDPVIVRLAQAAFAAAGSTVEIPPPPRTDIINALAQYSSGPPGPVADLLRVDLSVAPTPQNQRSRLGGCGGDPGGFPNGRRPTDDVLDCFLRVGLGLTVPGFNVAPNNRVGDGVNVNDVPIREQFPYLAPAQSGRQSRHRDPGEPGCQGGTCATDG